MNTVHEEKELRQLQIFLDDINTILEEKLEKFDQNSQEVLSSQTMNELLQENLLLEKSISLLESKHTDIVSSFKKIRKTQEKYQMLYYETFQKYHDLYEYSPILYHSTNLLGKIITCNLTYSQSLGYTKTEVLNSSIFDHVAVKSIYTLKEIFHKWKTNGSVPATKIWMKRKDNSTFPAIIEIKSIFSKNGSMIGSYTAIQDITQIHNLHQELEVINSKLALQLQKTAKLNRTKDEFMAMITHELKTPLVPIKGYADLLFHDKLGTLSAEQKNRIRIIQESADNLMSLITDLLDVQKIELGEFKLNVEKTNLSQLVENVAKKMSTLSDSVKLKLDVMQNIFCCCDGHRIEQVLANILRNAIDFSPSNDYVTIILKQSESHIVISISDNGIGLSKKEQKKIFQKFYQADISLTRNHGGTGLGLSISKGIIESHKGLIEVHSKGKNKGATFTIKLPKNL